MLKGGTVHQDMVLGEEELKELTEICYESAGEGSALGEKGHTLAGFGQEAISNEGKERRNKKFGRGGGGRQMGCSLYSGIRE